MATVDVVQPQNEYQQYRGLLTKALETGSADMARSALDLAITATERLKAKTSESALVELTPDGRLVAKTLQGLMEIGKLYAISQMVPERFFNKPNDCAIGAQMAMRLNCDTMLLLQNLYVVYGNPGVTGKFMAALLNVSPKIKGRVKFTLGGEGKNRFCEASAVDAETGETHVQRVDLALAEREGWSKPRKEQVSKWVTMPDIMLQYRAVAFLGRINFPDVVMGMQTVEELEDTFGESLIGGHSAGSEMKEVDAAQVLEAAQTQTVVSHVADAAKKVEPKKEAEPVVESAKEKGPAKSEDGLSDYCKRTVIRIQRCPKLELLQGVVSAALSPATAEEPLSDAEKSAIEVAAKKRREELGQGGK